MKNNVVSSEADIFTLEKQKLVFNFAYHQPVLLINNYWSKINIQIYQLLIILLNHQFYW